MNFHGFRVDIFKGIRKHQISRSANFPIDRIFFTELLFAFSTFFFVSFSLFAAQSCQRERKKREIEIEKGREREREREKVR